MPLIYCLECAKQISSLFAVCPNCGAKVPGAKPPPPPAPVKIAPAPKPRSINITAVFGCVGAIGVAFLVAIACWRVLSGSALARGGTSQASAHGDDAARFIARYGPPDRDDSNQYETPRPPMVTRSMSYDSEWVRAIFIPRAQPGASPPYPEWKLMVVQDMKDLNALSNDQIAERLSGRLAKR